MKAVQAMSRRAHQQTKKGDRFAGTLTPKVEYAVKGNVRTVLPYVYTFSCFAKGRWLGRKIIEVCTKEFGAHPHEYWSRAIRTGFVTVNDKLVTEEYTFKNSDEFVHMTHRHEPSVMGKISLVGETDTMIAVNKPSSLPMHPCGAYRYNSLLQILTHEPLIADQPKLYIVHRLDRVTSGLVVIAKNSEAANAISEEIRGGHTEKTYLARVKGRFPAELSKFKHRFSGEELMRVRYGAAAAEGGDDDDDDNDGGDGGRAKRKGGNKKRKIEVLEDDDKITGKEEATAMPLQEVRDSLSVGYGYSKEDGEGEEEGGKSLILRCPLQVVSHREGIHSCNPGGKESVSGFKMLGYDEDSDTSLVQCRPFTGRTHQLRLHLQLLGNPIANDPCYGGSLFYGDEDKRVKASKALHRMQALGLHPLSRIPHFDSTISAVAETMTEEAQVGSVKKEEEEGEGNARREGENKEDFVARTCKYCLAQQHDEATELEAALHCDGIWLHALQYKGRTWSFKTDMPDWADGFSSGSSSSSKEKA
jgi:23S rRNA-/tRNA-specific pseudouridylate synthase